MANWKCGASRSLPLARRNSWDGAAAKARIFSWAGWPDNPQPAKAKTCFLAYDASAADKKGSYKLPFADIVDGTATAIDAGVNAASSRLPGTHIPDAVKDTAKSVIEHYQRRFEKGKEKEAALTGSLQLQAASGQPPAARREYRATFIKAGRVRRADNSPGPFTVPAQAIQTALNRHKFTALGTFIDHPGFFEHPSLRNLAGTTITAQWDEQAQAATGTIRLYDNPAGNIIKSLLDQILADSYDGEPVPDVGLSLVFWPHWKPRDNPEDLLTLHEFRHIESVDFVFQPAADGRVQEALTALSALDPDPSDWGSETDPGQLATAPNPTEGRENMPPEELNDTPPETPPEPPAARSQPPAALNDWSEAAQRAASDTIIAGSGLPAATQAYLHTQTWDTPADLEQAIRAQQDLIAELRADDVVQVGGQPPRGGAITLGRTGLEQVTQAFEALMEGTSPPTGVAPLSGLRELYHLLSGDYEMHGLYQQDRIHLANVNSTTMAGLVANALNKALVNAFAIYPRWWEPIVTVMNFSNLQDVRWVTLGGVGELPTVAEGAAYTELTWDDQTETDSFVKKGGYLGVTLEAIDKDDIGALRATPRALAQAAWLTLSKSISEIFTSNSGVGPTMADAIALFNASHSNLGTTALSWAEWNVVRIAMQKQTEVNSSERLGGLTAPRYILVPIDLELTALQILASEGEPGTADNDENPWAAGNGHDERMRNARSRVIVVPLWTDTNNWAAVADPRMYPSIGLGYRYGSTPEIFSVASPTAGLMFTNDTLPVKVRYFYATGPVDYRGLYKENVA
jgi:hypothetical protein